MSIRDDERRWEGPTYWQSADTDTLEASANELEALTDADPVDTGLVVMLRLEVTRRRECAARAILKRTAEKEKE